MTWPLTEGDTGHRLAKAVSSTLRTHRERSPAAILKSDDGTVVRVPGLRSGAGDDADRCSFHGGKHKQVNHCGRVLELFRPFRKNHHMETKIHAHGST